jgi:hypothetical protein
MLHWKKKNPKSKKKKKKASHIFSFNVLGRTYTAVVPFLMFFILASTFFPTNLTHYCFKIQFIPYITKKKPWSECSFFLSNLGLLAKIIIWNSWILYSLSFKSGWQIQSCFDTAACLFVLWLKTISFSAFCYLLTTWLITY